MDMQYALTIGADDYITNPLTGAKLIAAHPHPFAGERNGRYHPAAQQGTQPACL